MQNIVLMGPAGSGKGTQAEYIAEKFSMLHLSTGELLRAEVESNSTLGQKISQIIHKGNLVSDELMIQLIKKQITASNNKVGVIFDGFPRTLTQAKALDDMLSETDESIYKVLIIEVPDEVLIRRITGRFSCNKCGAIYHEEFKKTKQDGICDICGFNEFSKRKDDTPESVKKRLGDFHNLTSKVLPYYEEQNNLCRINGNRSIDVISNDILSILS